MTIDEDIRELEEFLQISEMIENSCKLSIPVVNYISVPHPVTGQSDSFTYQEQYKLSELCSLLSHLEIRDWQMRTAKSAREIVSHVSDQIVQD